MGTRPLRQFYGGEPVFDVELRADEIIEPWRRHRQRLAAQLEALSGDQWTAPTRCDGWTARDVVSHLITVDGFWVVSLLSGQAGTPTEFIHDFDPTQMPEALVEPMRATPVDELLATFLAGSATFEQTVDSFSDEQWELAAENPFGHVPAWVALAHAHWDSWLHEYDIFAVDEPAEVERDELWISLWYSLFFAGVQGGLLGDEGSVGPGPREPMAYLLRFDEFETGMELRISERVVMRPVANGTAPVGCAEIDVGSALVLVEQFTGRRSLEPGPLPDDLYQQFARAAQVL